MKIETIYDVKKENKSQENEKRRKTGSKEKAIKYGNSNKLLRDKQFEKEKEIVLREGWAKKFSNLESRCSIFFRQIITNLEAFKSLNTHLL